MQRIPYEITLSKARNQVGASFFFFSDVRIFFLVFAQFFCLCFVVGFRFGDVEVLCF